ncbi:MAG TPA: HPP family protein [Parasulfuritortus sp.]
MKPAAAIALPPRPTWSRIALGWLGSLLAIVLVAGLADASQRILVLGSFGASCVLVFGFPDLPFSQPRHVLLGHVLSSAIGLAALTLFGPGPLPMALATATAVAAMMALRCVHPPAGSNPVIVFLTQPGWSFLLWPTALGALLLLAVALVFNNLGRTRRYPQYW